MDLCDYGDGVRGAGGGGGGEESGLLVDCRAVGTQEPVSWIGVNKLYNHLQRTRRENTTIAHRLLNKRIPTAMRKAR